MGIVADGVESADDASYRCAGDDVDGDACLFQHFQHADMSHALGTAAAKDDAHGSSLRTLLLRLFLFLRIGCATHQHNSQYHDYLLHLFNFDISCDIPMSSYPCAP